ncbi:MAG: repeat protein, partial [Bacteroidetes bacterium]|nr:repeat protein [Bacteroidota bacterium]
GYLNALGKLMIPHTAGKSPYTFKNGMFERSLEQDRKILIDTNGKQVLPGFYNEFEETPSKAILIRKGKKSGLIDSSGKIIIPCVYDDIKFLDIPGVPAVYNLIIVKQLNFYGAYNFQGKQIVPVKYQSVSEDYHTGKIAVKLLGKWGVIDSTGAMIVKPVYEEIGLLTRANYKFKSLGKWGLGNYADPKLNVSPQYSEIDWSWDDSHYFTVRKGGKAGLISADGKIILNAEYGYIEPRPDSYFWRYRDRIDPTFASKLPKDFYYVTKDEKKGIYSISRQWVVPLEYDKIDRYNNGVAEALKGKKKILLDASGKEFIPGGLDNNASYTKYVDDIIVVTINKKSGLYRKNGELILPAEYDSIGDYKLSYDDHGFALFYKDNKVGVLDYKGKIAVALSNHTFLNNFRDGAGIISENGYVWAYIDPKGELIWKEEKKSGNFYRAIPQVCLYDKMESLTFGNAEQSFDEYFTFPPCLFTLGNLKRLSILNKQIDSLPATIGKLSRLNYFQLSSNKALHFPEEFSALKNIDTLVVTANNPLPEKVNQLPALKYLSFNSPSSADLPLLPQLKHLVYYGDTLPAVTSKFENLETLEFRNTQLYSNSESNAATAKRELKECDAGRMPSCIFNLKNLKRLIIDHTKVDSIPPAIGNLSQLNYLFIKLSPINRFPSSLMNLKNLDTLIIDTYTSLDSGLTFPNVKYFSCRQGVLPVLPSAKYIKCEKVELPASLVKSTSLETLDVSVDNTMGGYYEGQTDLALDLKNFFATLEKIPTLRTLAISTKADTGGGIVSELIRNKEGLDKCKSIRKVVVENYQFIVGDKERFESAFPGITLERK